MNRDTLWTIARERAVLDRQEFLACYGGVNADAESEIERFHVFKGMPFKESMSLDREGVRLALLAAECWYTGSCDAQVGREKRHASAMYKRVHELRCKLFGLTRLESEMRKCVSVPLHEVGEIMKAGLAKPGTFCTLS